MVSGTKFHRGILKAGLGRMSKSNRNTKSNGNTKTARKGKSKPSGVEVSLDNADKVIEGGPLLISRPGEVSLSFQSALAQQAARQRMLYF